MRPACLLDKPGGDDIIRHRKGAVATVSPNRSNYDELTVRVPPDGQHAFMVSM